MNPWLYAVVAVVPGATIAGFLTGSTLWAWGAPAFVFLLMPLIEILAPAPRENVSDQRAMSELRGLRYDLPIFVAVALHGVTLALFFGRITDFSGWTAVGLVVSTGLSCGALGINIGHELGHRRGAGHQFLAKLMLSTSLYSHFFVEHNRGHHARVGTDMDPATARRGEWLFAFWLRSGIGGLISAWRLEADRLGRIKRSAWSWRNEVLRWQLAQGLGLLLIGLLGGPERLLSFVLAALGGAALLETVNYLEHYGLRRGRKEDGRKEPVRPVHSWNSNALLSRLFLFELSRHSDHHAHPRRAYAALRHFDESPQLPTGYPGMILLALVPPLFIRAMDARLDRLEPADA